ncbi:hypothetical protein C8R46DRAFT_1025746 [Mycena filopes]|nr:hypothetical protein C8R46DRAFT_1025746 [Mycena filopes]
MYSYNHHTSSEMAHQHNHEYSDNIDFPRDQSLEPYPSLPITYPESSQRTPVQVQFRQMARETPPIRRPYLEQSFMPSASTFSPPPVPSDRPPPTLRLPTPPSFPNPSFHYSEASQDASSSHRPGGVGSYRALSLSLSESEDDYTGDPVRPNPSNFILIVPPATETTNGYGSGSALKPSYAPDSVVSNPQSDSEHSPSPPIAIETIPSRVERREGRRRKGPEKMHACGICHKEFPRPSAVKTHMNVHNNIRPHKCWFPDCPKTFSVLSNARRHFRTHGGKQPSQGPTSDSELTWTPIDPPPPPAIAHKQARFNVRWVPTNKPSLSKAAPHTKPAPKTDRFNFHEQQSPMFLYDPFPTSSSDQVYDTGSSRGHHSGRK